MGKRILAHINPVALQWPREIRGMPIEVAAKYAGISSGKLEAFEDPESDERPTITQLRKLARLYKKPTAFFYLDELPQKPSFPHDYRLSPAVTGKPTYETLDAVIEVGQRRLDAIDLSDRLGVSPPQFPVTVGTQRPESQDLGREIRSVLGIQMEQQRSWRGDYYKALRAWSDAVEQSGVLVCQFSRVDTEFGYGFSLPDRPYPVVAINGGDKWPQRKIFTMMHELAHVALDVPGVCDPFHLPLERHDRDARIERYCNEVASEVLMSADAVIAEPIVRRSGGSWGFTDLDELRRIYSVSFSAMAVRLVQLGLMTQDTYDQFEYDDIIVEKGSGGYLSWPIRYVRDNGRRFTSLVLDAYASELVTSADASRLLGSIKLDHLPAMRNTLR